MKRRQSSDLEQKVVGEEPVKKPKTKSEWISGTALYNILLNDHLQEWVKIHSPEQIGERGLFLETLMNSGKEFEKTIFSLLENKIGNQPVAFFPNQYHREMIDDVRRAMIEQKVVLFSPSVYSSTLKFYGVPDLLIRVEDVNQIVPDCLTPEEIEQYKHGYLIIDVKFMTLPLSADGIHMVNSGHLPAYKGQLYIYHSIIREISENIGLPVVPFACLLGRAAKQTTKGETYYYESFEKMGRVDFTDRDKHVPTAVENGVEWVRECRKNGQDWLEDLEEHPELYPNMKAHGENSFKAGFAEALGEITSLWYCGLKERQKAFQQGIKSWKDENFTSQTVGFKGDRAKVLDAILEVNRGNDLILPLKMTKMIKAIQRVNQKEFFVDFETIPEFLGEERIFMISAGWIEYDLDLEEHWRCETFVLESLSDESEMKMAREFLQLIGDDSELYHWADAEFHIWENFCIRHRKYNDPQFHIRDRWTDLLFVFKQEPIAVKGAFNFSLKSIVKALSATIGLSYQGEVKDGLTAAVHAVNHYAQFQRYQPTPEMREIVKYNQLDCEALWKILGLLRDMNGI
jgi:predicted RecB family nuclease